MKGSWEPERKCAVKISINWNSRLPKDSARKALEALMLAADRMGDFEELVEVIRVRPNLEKNIVFEIVIGCKIEDKLMIQALHVSSAEHEANVIASGLIGAIKKAVGQRAGEITVRLDSLKWCASRMQ